MWPLLTEATLFWVCLTFASWNGASGFRQTARPMRPLTQLQSTGTASTDSDAMLAYVQKRLTEKGSEMIAGLRKDGYAVVDDCLSLATMRSLRQEAEGLYRLGKFSVSQSTRWCPKQMKQIYYDKHNVFSFQLNGGQDYFSSPRLHEYVVSCVSSVSSLLQTAFPHAQLSNKLASNKLAVCIGEGSGYDKHFDNAGALDTRKVTVLYYMNEYWRPENGGEFRIYKTDASSGEQVTVDIEPRGDRLLVFWSDVLVHSVQPSFAQNGEVDHRYALTVWLTSTTTDAIINDSEEVKRHFG